MRAWLERSAKELSAPQLWRLFKLAFEALWSRTKTTLGEVTLVAIGDRVLYNAADKFPFLSAVKIDAKGGTQFRELDERVHAVDRVELEEGVRFVLTELLTVLGALTAEILSPELHAALSAVALAGPARDEERATSVARDGRDENEGKRS